MADYAVTITGNRIESNGTCTANCAIQTRVSGVILPDLATSVNVAFGASAAATNNNLLAAAKAEAQRIHGLTNNQGGTDRTALFGGRAV